MSLPWWEWVAYPLAFIAGCGLTWTIHQRFAPGIQRLMEAEDKAVRQALHNLFITDVPPRSIVRIRFWGAPFLALLIFLTTGSLLFALMGGAALYLGPTLWLQRARRRRRERLEGQVLDLIHSLAATSKSGMSLQQSVEEVANHLPPPMSEEFSLVLQRVRGGQSLEKALAACDSRVGLANLSLVLQSLILNERRGGPLPTLLDKIATSLQAISKVEERVKTETSGVRLASRLMAAMPVLVCALLYLASPDHVGMLFNSLIGNLILLLALALDVVGFTILRRIADLEV